MLIFSRYGAPTHGLGGIDLSLLRLFKILALHTLSFHLNTDPVYLLHLEDPVVRVLGLLATNLSLDKLLLLLLDDDDHLLASNNKSLEALDDQTSQVSNRLLLEFFDLLLEALISDLQVRDDGFAVLNHGISKVFRLLLCERTVEALALLLAVLEPLVLSLLLPVLNQVRDLLDMVVSLVGESVADLKLQLLVFDGELLDLAIDGIGDLLGS